MSVSLRNMRAADWNMLNCSGWTAAVLYRHGEPNSTGDTHSNMKFHTFPSVQTLCHSGSQYPYSTRAQASKLVIVVWLTGECIVQKQENRRLELAPLLRVDCSSPLHARRTHQHTCHTLQNKISHFPSVQTLCHSGSQYP